MLTDELSQTGDTPTVHTEITPPPIFSPFAPSTSCDELNLPTANNNAGRPATAPVQQFGLESGPISWGSFELVRMLGQGAMGTVYEARDTLLDRFVALKILAHGHSSSRKIGAAGCLHEARAAAKLDHPNIISIYQVGEHEGIGFIAMQLVRGASAAENLPMDANESLRVVRAVAIALGYAHKRGLVHRDVKPENVLIGEDGCIKLADFGLAQVQTHGSTGEVCDRVAGTPAFMSPEQAQGLSLDGRSDLYSLGAMWFALLAGHPPLLGSNMAEVLLAQVECTPPDVRSLRPDVPVAFAELIAELLSKRPDDRPATAEEVVATIDAIIANTLTVTEATSVVASRPKSFSRRVKWVLLASLVGGPLGAIFALGNADKVDPRKVEDFALVADVASAKSEDNFSIVPMIPVAAVEALGQPESPANEVPRMAEPTEPGPLPAIEKPAEANSTSSAAPGSNSAPTIDNPGQITLGNGRAAMSLFYPIAVTGSQQATGRPGGYFPASLPFGGASVKNPPQAATAKSQPGYHRQR